MQQSSKIESPLTHRSFPFLTAMRRIVLAEYVQGKNKMHRPDRDIQTLFGHFAFFRDPYNQKVYTSYDARIMASATSLFWGLTSWWPHLNLHEVLFARAPSDGCWPDFRSTETHTLSKHTTRCRPRQNMQWPNFLSADPRICDLHKTKSSTATPYVLNRFPSCRQMLMIEQEKNGISTTPNVLNCILFTRRTRMKYAQNKSNATAWMLFWLPVCQHVSMQRTQRTVYDPI